MASIQMLEFLLADNNINIEDYGLDDTDLCFIKVSSYCVYEAICDYDYVDISFQASSYSRNHRLTEY